MPCVAVAKPLTQTPGRCCSAFVPNIVDPSQVERHSQLRDAAQIDALPCLNRLLRCTRLDNFNLAGQHQVRPNDVASTSDGRELTLGERRAMARRPSRAALESVMRDPHPLVARVILANPRITEDDVVFMAARRPVVASLHIEIAQSRCRHGRVRRAIVLNPGAPTAVTVPLLGLMNARDLSDVAQASDLPNVVRATARELLELRGGLDDQIPTELPH